MWYPTRTERLIISQPPSSTPYYLDLAIMTIGRRHIARLQAANAVLEQRLAELTARSDRLQNDLAQEQIARSQCNERLAAMAATINELQRTNTELNAAWHADRQQILELLP